MSTSFDIARPDGMPPGSGATPKAFEKAKRRETRTIEDDWDQFFDKLSNQIEDTEKSFDRILYRDGVTNQKYYESQFFWRFSDYDDSIRDLPHSSQDPFYPHNLFRYFVDLSVAAAIEASPDTVIAPSGRDIKNVRAAEGAQRLVDYCEQELLTEEFRLESEKVRQMYSGSWWYTYWSMEAGSLFTELPRFGEPQGQGGEDSFICKCGGNDAPNMGPVSRLVKSPIGPKCPDCGNTNVMVIKASMAETVPLIQGYDRERVGFPVLRCVSPLQMKGDRSNGHYLAGEWLRWKRLIDSDVAAEQMPWWEPGSSKKGSGLDDAGIRAEELARRPVGLSPAALAMSGSMDAAEGRTVAQDLWLKPSKYSHVEFNHDIVFVGRKDTPVPAFTRLGEVFPEGLRMTKLGSEWVDHDKQDFRKHWTYVPYVYLPHKADGGTTISDMREPQMEMIKARSLMFLYLMARAGGMPTIIKAPLTEADYDGSPASITPLPFGAPDPKDLIYQGAYPPADGNLNAYATGMAGEMQIMAQVVSPNTTGDPSAVEMGGTDTARGMMIMNAKAQGLQGPKLMPLAFGMSRVAEQWIALFRDNVGEEVPIPMLGDEGTAEWAMLKGSDLEGDFFVYPRPKSWLPHPREEKQAALQNMFTVFGPLFLQPGTPPELLRYIAEQYQLGDLPFGDYTQEARNAQVRIEALSAAAGQAKQLAEWQAMSNPMAVLSGQTDPSQMAATVLSQMYPVDPKLDDATSYAQVMKEWLRGDQGKKADPVARAAVRSQWEQYEQIVQQQQQQQIEQQIKIAGAMAQAQEGAKAQGGLQLEQARQQGRMAEIGAKGQGEMAKVAMKGHADIANTLAQPAPPGPVIQPPEPEPDQILPHLLDKDKEEQHHKHRMDEMVAKAGLDAVLKPPQVPGQQAGGSQAGVHGLASGYPLVPALGGLPSQAAI